MGASRCAIPFLPNRHSARSIRSVWPLRSASPISWRRAWVFSSSRNPMASPFSRNRTRVSTGVLIALGPRALLPVIAGTMAATLAANLLGDRNIWSAIFFALSNAVEPALVATLIAHYFGPSFSLDRLRNVIGLLAAAVVATAISGIVGTLGFRLFHSSSTSFLTIWHHWFLSDAIGIVTVAPLLIGLVSALRDPPRHHEISEGAAMLVLLIIARRRSLFCCRGSHGWPCCPLACSFRCCCG